LFFVGKETPTTPSRKRQLPPVPDNSNILLADETGCVNKQLDTRFVSDERTAISDECNVDAVTIETADLLQRSLTTDESGNSKTFVGDLNISGMSSFENVDSKRSPTSSPSIMQTERVCPPAVKLQRKTILVREEEGVFKEEKMLDKSVVVSDVSEVQRDLNNDLVYDATTKLTTSLVGVRGANSDRTVPDVSTTSGQRASNIEQVGVFINGSVVDKSTSANMISSDERPAANSPVALRRSIFRNSGKSNSEQCCHVLDGSLVDQSSAGISVATCERRPTVITSPMTARRSAFVNGAQRLADRGVLSSSRLTGTASETSPATRPMSSKSTEQQGQGQSAMINSTTTITRSRSTLGTVSSPPEPTSSVPDALLRSSPSSSTSSSSAARAVSSTMFRRRGSSPVPMVTARKSTVDVKQNGRAVSSSRDSSATRASTRTVVVSGSVSTRPGVRAQSITRTTGGMASQEKTTVGRSLSATRRPSSPINGATFTPISKPPSGDVTPRASDSARTIPLRQSLTPRSPDKHLLVQARRSITSTVAGSHGMTSTPVMAGSRASRSTNRSSMSKVNATLPCSSSPMLESTSITEFSRTVSSQMRAITLNGSRDTNGSRDSVGTSGSSESETALSASSDSSTAKNHNGQVSNMIV